jgi:uncharacterized membrane protein YbaN (DUF454 family)
MNRRYTIACFLSIAALFVFTQSAWLMTASEPAPELSDWLADYRFTSSVESFGIASLLIGLALGLWRFPHKVIYWLSVLLILFVTWFYLGLGLWAHFVELPKRFAGADVSLPPYFSFKQPLVAIPRVMLHILIPVSVALAFSLLLKNRSIEQDASGNRR